MSLENFRDVSSVGSDVAAGFQFEFYCTHCSTKWKSNFRPYRMGQVAGFLLRFAFLFDSFRKYGRATGNFSDMGSRGARERALEDAQAEAASRFTACPQCHQAVCHDCFDSSAGICRTCSQRSLAEQPAGSGRGGYQAASAGGHTCPNCSTPTDGGRFCPECGFDMASTHKSCPGCGTMVARASRYCTDCGHAF